MAFWQMADACGLEVVYVRGFAWGDEHAWNKIKLDGKWYNVDVTGEDPSVLQKEIAEQSSQLKSVFDKQEKLACLRQELSQLVTEQEYFNQYVKESDVHTDSIKFKKKLSSKQWMVLWQECQSISEEKTSIGFWFKIKALFKYGVTDWSIYKQDISKIITTFQAMYYRAKQAELSAEIADIEKYSNSVNKNLLEDLCKQSMVVLKDKLARKYEGNSSRKTLVKIICGRNHTMYWLSIRLY